MEKHVVLILVILLNTQVFSQNPIIRDQFMADPTARVFNGKVYLFPSHDIISPTEPEREWFSMEDYHVFSSENLVDWEDHGVIITQNKVPWVREDSYAMWALMRLKKMGNIISIFLPLLSLSLGVVQ